MHSVVVVDDEPASLRAVRRTLLEDCRVLTCERGSAALEMLHDPTVAALIVDQRMPEMLGTELLARAAASHPQVPRLLLTGYTDIGTLVEAINAGHVFAYITKPWEPGGLRLLVRRALERFEVEADRRRLLGEWQQSCEQLRQAQERQQRLMAVAGHELRTPVHLLSGALDLLQAQGPPASWQPWLDTAHAAAGWLGRAVRQLHTAVQWNGTAPPLDRRPHDLTVVADDLAAAFAPIVERRRLWLERTTSIPPPPVARVDRDWIWHAAVALLSNAVRNTPDGGWIELRVEADAGAPVLVVADHGIGIAGECLPHLFEPFSRASGSVDNHTSGAFEFGSRGLGLGLSTAAAIVAVHGGRLTVTSKLHEGSTFRLCLPSNC